MTANTYSYMYGNNTVSVAFGDTVIEEMVDGSILVNGRRLLISNDVDNTLTLAGKAADAKATGDALAKKAEYVLLWSNASRTSAFAAQTIKVGTVGYDHLLVVCGYDEWIVDGQGVQHVWLRTKGSGDTHISLIVERISEKATVKAYRNMTVPYSRTEITFSGGYLNGTADDTACIPYYIYGIKGVNNP